MRDPEDDKLESLILSGAIEAVGINPDNGEILYNFTPKLAEIDPELNKKIKEHFHREMMFLWVNGFIDMDVTIPNPIIYLNKKAFDEKQVSKLNKEQRFNLQEIIRVLAEENR